MMSNAPYTPGYAINAWKDAAARFWTSMHEAVFRASNGMLFNRFFGMPVVMLTTTGRKSGLPRTTMLTSPVQDGDRIVLVASYGGDDRDPQWFKNLAAHPEATIQLGAETIPVRAAVASDEEKKALWPKVVASYKGYDGYQRKTSRDIPVVILTRR